MTDLFNLKDTRISVIGKNTAKKQFHRNYELIYVLEGSVKLEVLEKKITLTGEDIIMIHSGEPYRYNSSEDALFVMIPIMYELVRQYGRLVFFCDTTIVNLDKHEELRKVLKQLMFKQTQIENDSRYEKVDFGYLSEYFKMVELLILQFTVNTLPEKFGEMTENNALRKIEIEEYMFDNYSQAITLRNLAEHLHLSEAHLSRWFKQTYGIGFSSMLRQIRLGQALEDLLYSNHPITRIAIDNGFLNISYFNRVFKEEYGKNPSEVRKHEGNAAGLDSRRQEALNKRFENYVKESIEELEKRENSSKHIYEIDTAKDQLFVPVWNQMINGGSAVQLLQKEMQKFIIQLRETLHYRFLRFWSIFSDELLFDINSADEQYNFSKLDQVLDFILSINLKPFIDLEEKPKRVNKSVETIIMYEDERIEFESMEKWRRLFTAIMKHWMKRYGREELSFWKIEVWYDGILIKGLDRRTNFFAVFKSTFEIVKKYVPEMEVGGSGIYEEFSLKFEKRKNNFWKQWVKYAPKPDFISLINFAYESNSDKEIYTKRSTKTQYLKDSVRQIRQELATVQWENIKLVISEWNLTVSDRNHMNDSCFQGAYIIKNMIEIYNLVDMIGYFSGTDLTREYFDSNKLLYGGTGLINQDGILKPSAYAIQFLNRLYPFACGKGENYLVTRNRYDNLGIICHNIKPLNFYYYSIAENEIDKDCVWKCFDDHSSLELMLNLNNVKNGTYRIKIYRINGKNGSILDMWRELDYYEDFSREDLEYLRTICSPKLSMIKTVVYNQNLQISIKMEPNEIAYLRISSELE